MQITDEFQIVEFIPASQQFRVGFLSPDLNKIYVIDDIESAIFNAIFSVGINFNEFDVFSVDKVTVNWRLDMSKVLESISVGWPMEIQRAAKKCQDYLAQCEAEIRERSNWGV